MPLNRHFSLPFITLLLLNLICGRAAAQWERMDIGGWLESVSTSGQTAYCVGGWEHDAGFIAKSTDLGETWNIVHSADVDIVDILAFSPDTVFAITATSLIRSVDGGSTFGNLYQGGIWGTLQGVQAFGSTIIIYTDQAMIRSDDSGSTWNGYSIGLTTVHEVEFVSFSIGYAVGWDNNAFNEKAFLKTVDGGQTWTDYDPGFGDIHSFEAIGVDTAIIFGEPNGSATQLLKRTTDGGNSWTSLTVPNQTENFFRIHFLDVNVGFITSEKVYKTVDGGQTWTLVYQDPISWDQLMDFDQFPSGGNGHYWWQGTHLEVYGYGAYLGRKKPLWPKFQSERNLLHRFFEWLYGRPAILENTEWRKDIYNG